MSMPVVTRVVRRWLLVSCVLGAASPAMAIKEFWEPANTVGAANSFGNLVISGHLGTVRFSKDEEYPLRYQFTSYREVDSPILGKGFFVPLLESAIIDHDWLLERTTLGGGTQFLYRSAHDPNHFESLDLSESADRRGSGSTVVVKTRDGFELEYRENRLSALRTPGGARATLRYNGEACASVDSSGAGSIVAFTMRGKDAREIRTHAGTYRLRMQPCPVLGDEAGEPRQTLAEIGWPDGRATTFAFSAQQKPARARIDIAFGGESASYAWDPSNDEIIEAAGVKYLVSPLDREYDPSDEHIQSGMYRIERQYPDRTKYIFVHDEDKGTIEETHRDKSQIVTHLFTARGATHGKIRKKERYEGAEKRVFYLAFYDVNGRVIREVKEGRVLFHLHAGGKMDESAIGPDDDFRKYDARGRLVHERAGGIERLIAYQPNGDRKITTKGSSGKVDTQFISADKR